MKRRIIAVLFLSIALVGFNSVAANAAPSSPQSKLCSAKNPSDTSSTIYFYYFTDSTGATRVRLTRVQAGATDTGGHGLDYGVYFNSDSGTAWGISGTNAGGFLDANVDPAANAPLSRHPHVDVYAGANNDGAPMCLMRYNLY